MDTMAKLLVANDEEEDLPPHNSKVETVYRSEWSSIEYIVITQSYSFGDTWNPVEFPETGSSWEREDNQCSSIYYRRIRWGRSKRSAWYCLFLVEEIINDNESVKTIKASKITILAEELEGAAAGSKRNLHHVGSRLQDESCKMRYRDQTAIKNEDTKPDHSFHYEHESAYVALLPASSTLPSLMPNSLEVRSSSCTYFDLLIIVDFGCLFLKPSCHCRIGFVVFLNICETS